MTEREMSQKLDELATRVNDAYDRTGDEDLALVVSELHKLSALKYVSPGHTSWDDVKKQAKPTKSRFPF